MHISCGKYIFYICLVFSRLGLYIRALVDFYTERFCNILFASEEALVDLRPLLSLFVDSFSDYGYYFGSYQSKLGQSAAEAACSAVNSLGGIVEFAALPSSAESEVLFDGALRVSRIDLAFAGGGAVSRPSGSDASSGLKMSLSFSAYGSTSLKKQGA